MRPNAGVSRALSFAVASLLGASPVTGQVLRGVVLDRASQKPVAGARVTVLVVAGTSTGDTITGADGAFSFELPAAGAYRVRVARLGYATTMTEAINVVAAFVSSIEVVLAPSPVPLDTLTVVAAKVAVEQQIPFLVDAGFYARRRRGMGHFLVRADLDKRLQDRMTDSFEGISGIHVVCSQRRMPVDCDVETPTATTLYFRGPCLVSVVLDGVLLRAGAYSSGRHPSTRC